MTVAQDASVIDAIRESRHILPRVSRTFAAGIKLLPPRLEPPVRIGYLLCRIADTIEDDLVLAPQRKAALLDGFVACFDAAELADRFGETIGELTSSRDYLELVGSTGNVFLMWRTLDAPSRAILRRWIEEMVRGMRRFVLEHPHGIRIASVEEFHDYCYYVAGTVGHLLTELWREHSSLIGARTYGRLLGDCEAFGEALQTVNILKDVAWDAERENAIYIPSELLAAVGSDHDGILRAERRAANRNALVPLLEIAQNDIERALRYIEAMPAAARANPSVLHLAGPVRDRDDARAGANRGDAGPGRRREDRTSRSAGADGGRIRVDVQQCLAAPARRPRAQAAVRVRARAG